jgi:hypothetical protein
MRLLLTSTLLSCLLGGACRSEPLPAPSPGPADPPAAGLASAAARDTAWAELEAQHAATVERRLAELAPGARAALLAELAATGEDPRRLRVHFSDHGVPADLTGLHVDAEALGLPEDSPRDAVASAFVARFAPIWGVSGEAFHGALAAIHERTVRFQQRLADLPIDGAELSVALDAAGAVVAVSGAFVPFAADTALAAPTLTEAEARVRAGAHETGDERPAAARLVVHVAPGAPARPAWRIDLERADQGLSRSLLVDAQSGALVAEAPIERHALDRSIWDQRDLYGAYGCNGWDATSRAACPHCAGRPPEDCACPRAGAGETGCEANIWRYREATGCVTDGDPAGEPSCGADATQLFTDAGRAYAYWRDRFGRDSFDDRGGRLFLKAGVTGVGGLTTGTDLDGDGVRDVHWISVRGTAAGPQLDGHELGHLLQFGTYAGITDAGFHGQGVDVMEHLADTHGFHYQGIGPGPSYRCDVPSRLHYSQFASADAGQSNKFIGNCYGYLLSSEGLSTTHYGVSVPGVGRTVWEELWYTALPRLRSSVSLFDYWNLVIQIALEKYGYTAPYKAALAARNAIGGWTDFGSVASGVPPSDRTSGVSWPNMHTETGAGPCVAFRPSWSLRTVQLSCLRAGAWSAALSINDDAVDPAASEPVATYRWESGRTFVYVFFRGLDSRVHYRRIDLAATPSPTIGPARDLGAAHLTARAPAVAPVWASTSGSADQLLVVYQPAARPTELRFTTLTSDATIAPPIDLGRAFDTDVAPTLVAYPYFGRAYLFRSDRAVAATPHRLRYASFTVGTGWSGLTDLTGQFNVPADYSRGMPLDVVRSDRPLAAAVHGVTTPRLRLLYVALPTADGRRELWYATLRETTPGVLAREAYRAVPLRAITPFSSSSVGGLAPAPWGDSLYHFWGQGGTTPKLFEARVYGD